jgi:adenine-specific DNA-methyltransferase
VLLLTGAGMSTTNREVLAALRTAFPQLFATRNENGQAVERIDLEKIRLLAGEGNYCDRYGLRWEDKPERFDSESVGKLPTLKRIPAKAVQADPAKPTHVLIQGDNYHALKLLAYTHERLVDVIYIDPPYGTGNKDFKYNDQWVDKEDSYRHSKWLSFMAKRLKLAKQLLKQDGVLITSIGEEELPRLVLLLEEYFPFVSEPLVWLSKNPLNQNKVSATSAVCHEYLVVAALREVSSKPETILLNCSELSEEAASKIASYPTGITLKRDLSAYKIQEVQGRRAILIPEGEFEIENWSKDSFRGHRFQKRTAQAGHGSEKYAQLSRALDQSGRKLIALLDVADRNGLGLKFLMGNSYFQSVDSKVQVKVPSFMGQYQGGYPGFASAKPVRLIQRLIKLYANPDSLIVDFFAGSGTTAEAVIRLNSEDGGTRQCILVTNDEGEFKDDEGNVLPGGICTHVTYPRLKKVIERDTTPKGKVAAGLGENLEFFETAFQAVPKSRRQLQSFVRHSTSLLQLKAGCFTTLEATSEWSLHTDATKHLFILFDDCAVDAAVERLRAVKGPILAFVFAYDSDDDSAELLSQLPNVTVQEVPQPLLDLFFRIKE